MSTSETASSDSADEAESYAFRWGAADQPYLVRLRRDYGLDDIAGRNAGGYGKVKAITAWAHRLWQHHGDSTPTSPDAITILDEAKARGSPRGPGSHRGTPASVGTAPKRPHPSALPAGWATGSGADMPRRERLAAGRRGAERLRLMRRDER